MARRLRPDSGRPLRHRPLRRQPDRGRESATRETGPLPLNRHTGRLAGRQVTLLSRLLHRDVTDAEAVTAADGVYDFDDLPIGDDQLTFTPPQGVGLPGPPLPPDERVPPGPYAVSVLNPWECVERDFRVRTDAQPRGKAAAWRWFACSQSTGGPRLSRARAERVGTWDQRTGQGPRTDLAQRTKDQGPDLRGAIDQIANHTNDHQAGENGQRRRNRNDHFRRPCRGMAACGRRTVRPATQSGTEEPSPCRPRSRRIRRRRHARLSRRRSDRESSRRL
jgi:hypothetical protein